MIQSSTEQAETVSGQESAGDAGAKILWCCHVRGPDDVHAAPDYETALKWADVCLEMDRTVGVKCAEKFGKLLAPMLNAVPAVWPHSPDAHAADLPKSVAYFSVPPDGEEPR